MDITRMNFLKLMAAAFLLLATACSEEPKGQAHYDVLIKGGTVYDGTGMAGQRADVGVRGDKIVAVGDLSRAEADTVIDARGKAVTPGFINMLSWATDSLMVDGRGLSDTMQGVTLEVFGEGWSMGPLAPHTKEQYQRRISATPQPYEITWTGFGEYLEAMESKGVSPNVASFIGATTVRINHVGNADRAPTVEELEAMKAEVAKAMEEGAMGLGTSLLYTPAFYAKTEELVALANVAGQYGGRYISHMRNEGSRILDALDELITIARDGGLPAEIYHLKTAGKDNWAKLDEVIARVEAAQAAGLDVSANMYNYTAGATGLDAAMPPWVQEGTYEDWARRLQDPAVRERLKTEMTTHSDEWENLMLASGPEGVLLPYFQNPELKKYTGMRLSEVAEQMGKTPEEAAMDLVIADGTRVSAIYFLMSEDNVKKKIRLPWVAFGSDAGSLNPEVAKKLGGMHPRAYGNVARLLGHYVRDEKVIPLAEAVHRLSGLPAARLKLKQRGFIRQGHFADLVVFDPATIADHATFEDPHQLSTGVSEVFVNGVQVVKAGAHTGATPGRVVRGPGWTGWKAAD